MADSQQQKTTHTPSWTSQGEMLSFTTNPSSSSSTSTSTATPLTIDPHNPRQAVYTAKNGEERLIINLDELEKFIDTYIGTYLPNPPQNADDVIKIIDCTMRALCAIPVNDELRDKAYKNNHGILNLHELILKQRPVACRELAIMCQAILAYYQIPAHIQIGQGQGRHAVIAVYCKDNGDGFFDEIVRLDPRWGVTESPTNQHYTHVGSSEIDCSFFSNTKAKVAQCFPLTPKDIEEIRHTILKRSDEYQSRRETRDTLEVIKEKKPGYLRV